MTLLLACLAESALAGVGPWTLGQNDVSVYASASTTRFSHLATGSGSFAATKPLGTILTETDLGVALSWGLLPLVELEMTESYAYSAAGVREGVCDDLPLAPCRTVQGLVPATAALKVRVLDEFAGRPLTLSLGPNLRLGDYTRADRQRLTQIGDGQTDLGATLDIGRTGGLGGGSYALFGEAGGRYRLPVADDRGHGVPGHEVNALADLLVYAGRSVGIGVSSSWEYRPTGWDIETMDPADPDRFTGLSYTAVKAGGRLVVRSARGASLVVSGDRMVYARNNPSDELTLGVGVAWFRAARPGAAP